MTSRATMEKPKLLYKYAKINNNTIDVIRYSTLWFSYSINLNDPFDSKYRLSDNFIKEILLSIAPKDYYENPHYYRNNGEQLTSNEFMKTLSEGIENGTLLNQIATSSFDNNGPALCCFTTKYDNKLMWSHYSDCHKGLCLIYDLSYEPEILKSLGPVVYTKNYPVVNSYKEIIEIGFFSKSIEWSYEEEWRAENKEEGNILIDPRCLKGIIFGAKCDEKSIITLFNACNLKERTDLKYYLIREDYSDYKLLLAPLKFEGLNL